MTASSVTPDLTSQPVPRTRVRFPLRAKITIPYLLLAIGLAIGAGYVVMRIVFDTTDERFSNQLIETEKLSAEWMVREENRLLKTLRILAFTQGMDTAIRDGDVQRLSELATSVAAAQGEEEVFLLDAKGEILLGIAREQGNAGSPYLVQERNGIEFDALPFVRKVISGELDTLGDKYSGIAMHHGMYYFYVSGPLRDDREQLVGVALVGKSLHSIVDQMREETLAQISLYDTSGKLLESTLTQSQSMSQEVAGQIIANKETSSLKRLLNDQRSFNILDLNYTEIIGAWQVRSSEVIGLIGASMINNYWVTASTPTRVQVAELVSLLVLLVFVVGVEIADRITYPLKSLVVASSQVAAGNLNVRLEPGGNDEVAYLTETFNMMVANLNQSRLDLIQAYDETISGWATMLDQRDQDTEGHTRRVSELTLEVARRFGLSDDELVHVRRGALLHDIGKMSVPDQILKKNGPLTPDEWVIMRLHPKIAHDVLEPIEYLRPALEIPYSHHERWDGSGYPRGLRGQDIPLAARIFSVVDVWDAMTSDRPYRSAMEPQDVINYIFEQREKMFDPQVVDVFWDIIKVNDPKLVKPILPADDDRNVA
ncbi:MAG TPA: HD domain-containing phosphohydrolase [Bellilinea sp.]|nr:HD domain-containing phosphohydrolase [Bellilinea sp.]